MRKTKLFVEHHDHRMQASFKLRSSGTSGVGSLQFVSTADRLAAAFAGTNFDLVLTVGLGWINFGFTATGTGLRQRHVEMLGGN